MNTEERSNRLDQVAARFKADDVFKQELLADPAGRLKAEGFEISSSLEVRASVNATGELQLMVRKASGELSDDDLHQIAGGSSWSAMASYRVWNANRNVFLYPENWLDPK